MRSAGPVKPVGNRGICYSEHSSDLRLIEIGVRGLAMSQLDAVGKTFVNGHGKTPIRFRIFPPSGRRGAPTADRPPGPYGYPTPLQCGGVNDKKTALTGRIRLSTLGANILLNNYTFCQLKYSVSMHFSVNSFIISTWVGQSSRGYDVTGYRF